MTFFSTVRAEPVEAPFFSRTLRSRIEERCFDKLSTNGKCDVGLTLVEMLVVLAIIGVAAGGVTLGIGAATRAPSVESEARRFATRLEAAGDDAMLGDRMVALTVDPSGYSFVKVTSDGSVPQGTPKLDHHTLPGGIAMTLDQRPPLVLGMDGVSKPLTATLMTGEQRWQVRYDGLTSRVTRLDQP